MALEDLDSFDEPTVLHLSRPYRLHPNACNPQMDLVVLLYLPTNEELENGDDGSTVELWRTSGEECVKVWERDVSGRIVGMDWSLDGLQLSLLTYSGFGASSSAQSYLLVHLSVHDGAPLATVSLNSEVVPSKDSWLSVRWTCASSPWPEIEKGSAAMILDALPSIEKVEPVLPPHLSAMYMYQPALALKAKKALDVPHASLANFPTLLSNSASQSSHPGILSISAMKQRLLTGTFPGQTEDAMRRARSAQRMKGILDNVIKGIEGAQAAWKEAAKQGMLWDDELEECETAAGESKGTAKAGLYALLLRGHSTQSVTDYFSHRVTGRSLTKWKTTVLHSLLKIHYLMVQSVIPGLERILLLLDEITGWSTQNDLEHFDKRAVEDCQRIAERLATMATYLNRDAEYKTRIAHEYFTWLAYEVELINNTDFETDIRLKANVVDAWEYLEHGQSLEKSFRKTRSVNYFPSFNLPAFKGPIDPGMLCPEDAERHREPESLNATLTETFKFLDGDQSSQSTRQPLIEISITSDTEETPSLDVAVPDQSWPCMTDLVPELVKRCQGLAGFGKSRAEESFDEPDAVVPLWSEDKFVWSVHLSSDHGPCLYVVREEVSQKGILAAVACLSLSGETDEELIAVGAVDFFDATEIVLVLVAGDGMTYLATVDFSTLDYEVREAMGECLSKRSSSTALDDLFPALSTASLTIHRSQVINTHHNSPSSKYSLALNGRKKRRTACVLTPDGKELQIFSLWISGVDDDGDDEDEDEEEAIAGDDAMEQ